MIDKYGTALGIFVCGILTYIFATLWLRTLTQYASDDYEHERGKFSRVLAIIGTIYRQLLTIIPFSNFTLNIRKKLQSFKLRIILNLRTKFSTGETSPRKSKHCGSSPCLDLELKIIVEQIINTYVKSWYYKFTSNNDFIRDIQTALEGTFCSIGDVASVIDKKQVMYDSVELYLHFISDLINAMKKVDCDTRNTYERCLKMKKEIGDNFQMEHWSMKDEASECCYLQSFTGILIAFFGPVEVFSSPLLKNVVTEVLTQNLVCPLIDLISDPDVINMWLLKFMKGYAKENNYMSCYSFIADAETVLCESKAVSTNDRIENNSTPVISVTPHFESLDNSEILQQDTSMKLNHSLYQYSMNVNQTSIESCDSESGSYKYLSDSCELCLKDKRSSFMGATGNQLTASFLAFPPVSGKARSDTNISGSELETNDIRNSESSPAEKCNIKRSKSADYIREMPNISALLPLNVKNHSIRICGKNNKTFVKLRTRENVSTDIETAQEAIETEVPCLFTNVKIINTELQEEPSHSPYTLYCIQYCGVFHNVASASNIPDLVQQVVNVKRRFREFLALQACLESNADIKGSLKGIRGPSKWLTSPFTNLDKRNIAERRAFLENYLQELCNRDIIANSSVFQEFLAYGGDASLAFVKRSPDMNVPRIDKIIYRGMKGAIDLFKIALPNSPLEAVPFKDMDSEVFESYKDEECSSEYKFKEYLIAFTKNDPEVGDGIAKYFKTYELASLCDDACDEDTYNLKDKYSGSSLNATSKRQSLIDPSITVNCEKNSLSTENLLTDTLVDVGFALLRSCPKIFKTDRLIFFFKCFLGSYINRFIDQKIAELWNKESCTSILHILHKTVWPEANSPKKKVEDPVDQAKLLNLAVRKIIKADYGILSSLLLSTNPYVSDALDLLLASFQNKKLNKCLMFHMLDVIAHSLCTVEEKDSTSHRMF